MGSFDLTVSFDLNYSILLNVGKMSEFKENKRKETGLFTPGHFDQSEFVLSLATGLN